MNNWIPVTERLPDTYGNYLCTLQDRYNRKRVFVKTIYYHIRPNYWKDGELAFGFEVVAWQPCAEPYRG